MQTILEQFMEVGIELNPDWLAALELCCEDSLTDEYVYQALISSDLRESCIPLNSAHQFPEILQSRKQFPRGSFLFQISESLDVSIPDAQRPRAEGTESTKRMLKFKLHLGGGAEIDAVELEPIAGLVDVPHNGMKIIIRNSPLVHRGLVLLRSENVKLVGGEVAHLTAIQKTVLSERVRLRDPLCARPAQSTELG